jgi:PAS domain S-box-containing protein
MNVRGWAEEAEASGEGAVSAARLAFAAAGMGWWRWDPATRSVWWSPELEHLYGFEAGTFGGDFDAYIEGIHPDDREHVAAVIERAVAERCDFTMEHRRVRPDGEVRWIEGRGAPVVDEHGTVREWVGIAIDVTARVQRDRELRDREIESSLAFAAGRMGSWRWNAETGRGFWSPELERLVGLEPGAYDGTWSSFVAPIVPDDHELLRREIEAAVQQDRDFSVRYRVRHTDGLLRWVETRGRRISGSDWVGVTIDVTELTEVEVAMRSARDRLEETVARLDALLEHASFGFAFVDPDERFVRVNSMFAEVTGRPPDAHVGRPVGEFVPQLTEVLRNPGSGVAGDGAELLGARADDGSDRHWLVARYPVLGADGRSLGAGLTAVDITERKRRERAIRLTAAASDLFSEAGRSDLLEQMATIPLPEFADMCVLYLAPRAGLSRRFAVAHVDPRVEPDLRDVEDRWPRDLDRLWAAVGDAPALLVPDVTPAQRRAFTSGDPEEVSFAEVHGAASVIVVPMRSATRDLGLLTCAYTNASGRRYRPDDVELAIALGARFADLIELAYLGREAERAKSRLDLLAAVSELLTVDLDTRARLDAIAQVVLPSFADDCAVYLPADDGGLGLAAHATTDTAVADHIAPLDAVGIHDRDGPAPPAMVMRTGAPVVIPRVTDEVRNQLDEAHTEAVFGGGVEVRSLVIVPLPGADGPIGVIAFGLRGTERTYDQEDGALAEEIARRVAPAVENALRYEQQSATAEALQRSLLPTALVRFVGADLAARYVPGSDGIRIGGDWYDAVGLPSGRLMIAIGDVVGHGIRAATWMGRLRTLVQFCAFEGLDPARVLGRLNEYCFRASGSDMATAIVGIFDPAEDALEFASAGHPPLVIRRASGAIDVVWEGRGPPLSAVERAAYVSARVALGPGDLLVLYTDGLVERRGEQFDAGVVRLCDALRGETVDLEATADHLITTLLGESRPADDVATLLLAPMSVGGDLDLDLASEARVLVGLRRTLARWLGAAGMTPDDTSELVVAVNEIAGNAIEHAYGPGDADFHLHAELRGQRVTIEIRDRGVWREPVAGNRGRGLGIAADLVDELRVERTERGTTVRMVRNLRGAG